MIPIKYLYIALCLMLVCISSLAHTREKKWSVNLTPAQKQRADEIIQEARPKIRTLRIALQNKMLELKEFHYKSSNDHDALALLGKELQQTREALRKELKLLDKRLMQEVGASLHGYRGHDCNDLVQGARQKSAQVEKRVIPTPHHTE